MFTITIVHEKSVHVLLTDQSVGGDYLPDNEDQFMLCDTT